MRQQTTFPENLRCVVLIGIDFDGASHEVGRGIAPLGKHSWGSYSARCGVPRHMDMLARHGVTGTFFIPGYDAQCHPQTIEQIDRNGYEVAAHGYLHEAWELGVEEEEALLRKTDGIPFSMTLFPQVYGNLDAWSDSHSFVIPHQRSMSNDRLDAAK